MSVAISLVIFALFDSVLYKFSVILLADQIFHARINFIVAMILVHVLLVVVHSYKCKRIVVVVVVLNFRDLFFWFFGTLAICCCRAFVVVVHTSSRIGLRPANVQLLSAMSHCCCAGTVIFLRQRFACCLPFCREFMPYLFPVCFLLLFASHMSCLGDTSVYKAKALC